MESKGSLNSKNNLREKREKSGELRFDFKTYHEAKVIKK